MEGATHNLSITVLFIITLYWEINKFVKKWLVHVTLAVTRHVFLLKH